MGRPAERPTLWLARNVGRHDAPILERALALMRPRPPATIDFQLTVTNTPHSMLRPLRIALVGAGKMGRHHAQAISRLGPSATLVAVADPSARAREAICSAFPGAAGFESIDALIDGVHPDVVHVCTAPDTHEALAA